MAERERIGLVLAGGGARGGYEAGALSVLLPALDARGQRPTTIVGTSVGAVNAAFLGANAHRPVGEMTAAWCERWRDLTVGQVIRPLVGPATPVAALRYLGEVLGVPGVRLAGLLDPEPLERTLEAFVDWRALERNVHDGTLDAVAVVATAARSVSSVVFVAGAEGADLTPSATIEYLLAELRAEHVQASAAIPVIFPARFVETPDAARGWYFDGGTRLNAPIKPALDLGVDRVIVVATHGIAPVHREPELERGSQPDFADGATQLIQATLVDPLEQDIRTLGTLNLLLGEDGAPPAAVKHRAARGKRPYRRVPYIFVSPPERDTVAGLAGEVVAERYGGLGGLRSPDLAVIERLLGGQGPASDELVSYLLFDRAFEERLIAQGRADAHRWLEQVDGPDGPWWTGPVDDLP